MRILEFIPATMKAARQLADEPEAFAAEFGIGLHEVSQEVGRASAEFLKSFPYENRPKFLGYFAIEGESQQMCGVGGFKGPPVEGAVEIAYYTFPGFEGRGIGTEMARFLAEQARAMPEVTLVVAHTLRERNASVGILEKIGMRFAGDDEEDGETVWRWELDVK
jgi:RimJ/RimL family protein N-acetyltransferase